MGKLKQWNVTYRCALCGDDTGAAGCETSDPEYSPVKALDSVPVYLPHICSDGQTGIAIPFKMVEIPFEV